MPWPYRNNNLQQHTFNIKKYNFRKQSRSKPKVTKFKADVSSSGADPGYPDVRIQQTNKGETTLEVKPERITSPHAPQPDADMYARVNKLREPVGSAKRPGPLIAKDGLLRRQQANNNVPMIDNELYVANNSASPGPQSPHRQRPHYGW